VNAVTNVCVTGASGFVGKNLVAYLTRAGHSVVPVDLRREMPAEPFSGADAVVHLAAKAHDLRNVTSPEEYYCVNDKLTRRVYDKFIESNARVFIFLSSVKAVADTAETVLTEETVPAPATHYGKSKRQAEEYIVAGSWPVSKKVYILRPCMIHGPGNKGNLNILVRLVRSGIPYPFASFHNQRSLLSIQNLCFLIEELILTDRVPSGIYNVSDDQALSANRIAEIIAQELQKRPRHLNIPKIMVRLLARAGDILHLPLNSERLNKLTGNYLVDGSRIVKIIGKPLPLTAEDGLRITLRSLESDR